MRPTTQVEGRVTARIPNRHVHRSAWIHPLVIFGFAWSFTLLLYDLHLSALLIYPTDAVVRIVMWILVPGVLSILVYLSCWSWRPFDATAFRLRSESCAAKLERKLRIAFMVWVALTIVEIGVSGGVPLWWLIQGSAKTYFDFGIQSMHGLLNSLLLVIGLLHFSLFASHRGARHLRIPIFILLWSLVVISRNLLIVMLIESAIVWVIFRGINWKTVGKAVLSTAALVLVFGYIGDVRTGSDAFLQLAQPEPNYPEWLPSGVLWVYIYVTTPINNLVNTVQSTAPLNSPLFPNATSLLFPSVLREVIYNPATLGDAVSGDLVTEAFNVSTAYVGPFQDYGRLGVAFFSMFLGWISAHFWRDRSLRGSLTYAVMGQCLAISVFFNHLFYLPVITQVVWLYLFLPKTAPVAVTPHSRDH